MHVLHPPEGEAAEAWQRTLNAATRVTTGKDVDPATQVLIAGVPTAEQLDRAPNLEAVIIPWAGVPKSTAELMVKRPHASLYNLHHNAGPTAEMAITLLLAAAKRVVPADRALRGHDWRPRLSHDDALGLDGKHALVVGFGAIGQRVARACEGLGMSVTAVSRRGGDHHRDSRVRSVTELLTLLPAADAVIVCVPGAPSTEGLIDADAFALLKPAAIIVNVSRGRVIDERALYDALREDRLFGAGIDVWYRYPREEPEYAEHAPSEFPFHELDNVVMSPHRGGHVRDTEPMRFRALAELVNRWSTDPDSVAAVDLEFGY